MFKNEQAIHPRQDRIHIHLSLSQFSFCPVGLFTIFNLTQIDVDNNDTSEKLSRFLSRKFSQMVYVSCSLMLSEEEERTLLSTLIERIALFL